jgi:DNA-binding NarL/FixJ family response regulator
MVPPNRLVVLEDHPLVREAMVSLLVPYVQDTQIVYAGASIDEAETAITSTGADLVILDLDLNDGRSPVSNVAAVADLGVPVLVVSALGDPATIRACLAAGALGFVSKQAKPSEVLQAIEAALRGEPVTSPEVAAALLSESADVLNLSDQERRAMVLYASGLKMESVARRMNVSRTTAEEYIKRVRAKAKKAGTPVPTKTDMYRMAQRTGMLP